MTAFAKASSSSPLGYFSLEIHSVNRKFLDIKLQLPDALAFAAEELYALVAQRVPIGQVTLCLQARFENTLPFQITANLTLAQELHKALQELAQALHVEEKTSLATLLQQNKELLLFTYPQEKKEQYQEVILSLAKEALCSLVKMKEHEGSLLAKEFIERLDALKTSMQKIEKRTKAAPDLLKHKLLTKLQEHFPSFLDHEERVGRELLLYCEKCDVQEEIQRFYSHCGQMQAGLQERSNGKKLDFISQEMSRELNTLGAKSQDGEIIKHLIEMKTQLSFMREQVHNVE